MSNNSKLFLINLIILCLVFIGYKKIRKAYGRFAGMRLNKKAWEATYNERGFEVPKQGPREGYWGKRIDPKMLHDDLGWHERPLFIPQIVDVDQNGFQYYQTPNKAKFEILIVGGSVAFGAYASEIAKTYFYHLGKLLENEGLFSNITIAASGAWKSRQELKLLEMKLKEKVPDLVVIIDGLNDLTSGATAKSLYGEEVAIENGKWTPSYHSKDYRERVEYYLQNINQAQKMISEKGADLLIVLQPALTEKPNKTEIEEILLKGSLLNLGSEEDITNSYSKIREELKGMTDVPRFFFLDCSKIFNHEKETTFVDIWHFSDFGHEIMGKEIFFKVNTILKKMEPPA